MSKKNSEGKLQILQLQLEEAIQMLRLVSMNQRTCMEVAEWLAMNYPEEENNNQDIISMMMTTPVIKDR